MNSLKSQIAFLALTVLCISVMGQEVRLELGLPLIDRSKLYTEVNVQTRKTFDPNLGLNKNMATLAVEYDLSNFFEFGASYRIISTRELGKTEEDNYLFDKEGARATVDFTVKTNNFNGLMIKNKVRYQVSDFEGNINKSFIRNKTLVYYKMSKKLKPYAGLEFIYRLEKNELKSFRIHWGSKMKIYKQELTGFFIIENEIKEFPINLNYIMGIKILI